MRSKFFFNVRRRPPESIMQFRNVSTLSENGLEYVELRLVPSSVYSLIPPEGGWRSDPLILGRILWPSPGKGANRPRGYYTEFFRFPDAESWKIGLTSSDAQPTSLRLKYLQWVLGLTVPSIPRSRLANLDGGFEYGAEREYSSQFMCSK